jgi:hypothetical protein
MRARGLRSLSLLAATVLLSAGQFSPVTAATISVSPDPVAFGNVTVGTTDTIPVTETLTPDAGANTFIWGVLGPGAPFSATMSSAPAGNCEDLTCVIDVSFTPTTTDVVGGTLSTIVSELASGNLVGMASSRVDVSGTGVAPVSNTPLPATLPLFASGLGALGLLGWRRKRKAGVGLLGAA